MSFWAGQGGKVIKDPSGSALEPAVGKWTLKKAVKLANVTNSKSSGHKQWKGTVKESDGTFELPWDDTINPDASGFKEGDVIGLELDLGLSGKKFTISSAVIESVDYVNDEDEDVVRAVCTFKCNALPTYS